MRWATPAHNPDRRNVHNSGGIELLVTRLAAKVARHSTHFPSPVNRTFSFVISAWNCSGSRAANLL
jgi:hypothetical protein